MSTTPSPTRDAFPTRLWIGIAVILFGILAGLQNLRVPGTDYLFDLWPLILVCIGLIKLLRPEPHRGFSGAGFVLIGAFLLVSNFGGMDLVETLWPLFVILVGALMVLKALSRNRSVPPEVSAQEGFLSGTALLGGVKRRLSGVEFRGGDMTAIFGGFDLDLRESLPPSQSTRLDIFILFGGGELKVPQGWAVDIKASAFAGAVEDKTLRLPEGSAGPLPRPTLVVTGMTLFGGMTVLN